MQCKVDRALNIGLIKEEIYGEKAYDILVQIFDEINTAFMLIEPEGLKNVTMTSQDELDDYVSSSNYM